MLLSAEFIAEATSGDLIRGRAIATDSGASIDSRTTRQGQVFFAIKGEHNDGHDFAIDAVNKGAVGIVVEKDKATEIAQKIPSQDVFLVAVSDTTKALVACARAWVEVLEPLVVAITGSVGKSTTKEMTASALARRYKVCASQGNQNNIYGLSLTCLSLLPEHEVLVCEMGMNHLGEIRELCSICRPRFGAVLCVAPVHLEGLGSLDGVALAKRELVEALPSDGTAFLNADDERVMAMQSVAKGEIVKVGWSSDADVRILESAITIDGLTRVRLWTKGEEKLAYLNVLGSQHAVNAGFAYAIAHKLEVPDEDALSAIQACQPLKHRMNLMRVHGFRILDDSYNASPKSMEAAIEVLCEIGQGSRKVAVLGDMLELGAFERQAHLELGKLCALKKVDILVTVGSMAGIVAEAAKAWGMPSSHIFVTTDAYGAAELLGALLKDGDVILLKGSRKVGLDHVASLFMAMTKATAQEGS
jgi:UDP-N-acetylmuramoyl-tripeptide--D-alanyl-D-alanine ligase